MRLDKFLKISRIIKRRTIAKEACVSGRVSINGKNAKASTEVKENDIIEIRFAKSELKAKVLNIASHVNKADAKNMYEIIIDSEENQP
ncbi:RNA-binding S4 domain-containing protein [Clostridium sediminicola]|uniref:RNA-binding S4 domain-containing protein n=1 Tax=Clostridium sediminicola TaxID=3114879 RepID=UPI0031F237E7